MNGCVALLGSISKRLATSGSKRLPGITAGSPLSSKYKVVQRPETAWRRFRSVGLPTSVLLGLMLLLMMLLGQVALPRVHAQPAASLPRPQSPEKGSPEKGSPEKPAATSPPKTTAGGTDAAKSKPARRTLDAKLLADLDPQKPDRGFARLGKAQAEIDSQRGVLVIEGVVCLREGQLELFACPKGTKEHESILSLATDAISVHAGLLAIGAEPGSPVKYVPEYSPASGPIVDMYVVWTDEEGKSKQARAQEWVRNVQSKKELESEWVFGGSGFNVIEDTGERYYLANSGDLICVSNFTTATLDLQVRSSQANAELMFEAFTDRIPPKGTKVKLVLLPRSVAKPKGDDPKKPAEKPAEKPAPAKNEDAGKKGASSEKRSSGSTTEGK